jgi:hypothetical protein
METIICIIALAIIAVGALVLLGIRETLHASELRELATIALTSHTAETVDERVRAVALTREALALQPVSREAPHEVESPAEAPAPIKGFRDTNGVKLEFATPFPREMMDDIPAGRRL